MTRTYWQLRTDAEHIVEAEVGDFLVRFARYGGGFVGAMHRERFEQMFVQTLDPKGPWKLVEVTIEDLGVSVPAYITNERWNGWLVPRFPRESITRLQQVIPELEWEGDTLFVRARPDYEDNEIDNPPETIDGLPVWQVGDGFTWELAQHTEEEEDAECS